MGAATAPTTPPRRTSRRTFLAGAALTAAAFLHKDTKHPRQVDHSIIAEIFHPDGTIERVPVYMEEGEPFWITLGEWLSRGLKARPTDEDGQ